MDDWLASLRFSYAISREEVRLWLRTPTKHYHYYSRTNGWKEFFPIADKDKFGAGFDMTFTQLTEYEQGLVYEWMVG